MTPFPARVLVYCSGPARTIHLTASPADQLAAQARDSLIDFNYLPVAAADVFQMSDANR
jgi:hypothetical protein